MTAVQNSGGEEVVDRRSTASLSDTIIPSNGHVNKGISLESKHCLSGCQVIFDLLSMPVAKRGDNGLGIPPTVSSKSAKLNSIVCNTVSPGRVEEVCWLPRVC